MGKGGRTNLETSGSGKDPAPYNTDSIHFAACKVGILILRNPNLIEILCPREKNSYHLFSFNHKAANLLKFNSYKALSELLHCLVSQNQTLEPMDFCD